MSKGEGNSKFTIQNSRKANMTTLYIRNILFKNRKLQKTKGAALSALPFES